MASNRSLSAQHCVQLHHELHKTQVYKQTVDAAVVEFISEQLPLNIFAIQLVDLETYKLPQRYLILERLQYEQPCTKLLHESALICFVNNTIPYIVH